MIASQKAEAEFAFGFDDPLPRKSLRRDLRITGWMVNTDGELIHGIRLIARSGFWPRRVARARRKRARPDIAAQFPDLPGAYTSGFLVETKLHSGRNKLALQVQDAQKQWRTLLNTEITVLPVDLLAQLRLREFHSSVEQRLAKRIRPSVEVQDPPRYAASESRLNSTLRTNSVTVYATTRSNLFIREVGELVVAGLSELDCVAKLVLDEMPQPSRPGVTQIVLTPHEYYNLFLLEQVPAETACDLTRDLVLLCTEQPDTAWFDQNLRWAPFARGVLDINPRGVASYRARGINAEHFPLGFHDILTADQPFKTDDRSIDLVFLGSLTPRRERFFARYGKFFSDRKCHLRFVPLGFAKTELSRSYLPADRRNNLLSDSKILLNVHYSDQPYFEWHRMLLGLANGCCIITEPCSGYAPLVPNKHFVMVEAEDLVAAAEYYLDHPEECAGIAAAGREFVRTNLRQSDQCRELLGTFASRGAAVSLRPLLIDPRPVELPIPLSRKVAAPGVQDLWAALRADLRNLFSPTRCETEDERIRPAISEAETQRLREDIINKRNAYRSRRAEQEQWRENGREICTVNDNAQVSHMDHPRVSIVITLYNYGRFIESCVRSLDQAARLADVPVELIIVDDCSTDDSLARARRAQEQSQRAVRVVHKHFNTGLADARNVGTQLARSAYVFMMDADNLVRPAALKQLLGAIEVGGYAAVYSILCRFRDSPENPIGLLSHYDWDPEILVQGPYVDAMAMFRRDVLLELGGYDHTLSEIGWFGWEDYDMWLRFAERDLPVAFVPNILCLYRQHQTSMIGATNLFASELVNLLQERYHSLSERFPARETLFGVERDKLAGCAELVEPVAAI